MLSLLGRQLGKIFIVTIETLAIKPARNLYLRLAVVRKRNGVIRFGLIIAIFRGLHRHHLLAGQRNGQLAVAGRRTQLRVLIRIIQIIVLAVHGNFHQRDLKLSGNGNELATFANPLTGGKSDAMTNSGSKPAPSASHNIKLHSPRHGRNRH